MSLQLLVIMVPVLFGLMGFALDLGRLYLIRGELNQAANAMASAAAAKLIGTSASLDDATLAALLTLDNADGRGNKYNFGSLSIGETTGLLSSQASDPQFFSSAAAAAGNDTLGGGEADGTTAKYVKINITADAPLLFWSVLSVGQQRSTPIAATAVAGISAPLCTACGIEPFAIAALSQDDATDFGFVPGTKYTLGFQCTILPGTPTPPPGALPGTAQRIPYLILNRLDDSSTQDESQQLYRIGAQGLLPSTTQAQSCITISAQEQIWASVVPQACSTNMVPTGVTATGCGIYSRFDVTPPGVCQNVTDIDTLSSSYVPDRDTADQDDYTAYTGNTRRIITVPIVDALSATDAMTVLGFRQFLLEPNQGDIANSPGDSNGRFAALYIGSVMPLKQGRFDGGCQAASGPGKVVFHQ